MPEDFGQLVLQIPREELLRRLPNAGLLTGRTVSARSPVGALVSRSLHQFFRAIGEPKDTVRHFMQDSLIDMVATGLSSLEASRPELSLPEQLTAVRAKAFIQSNLDNPAPDCTRVANAVGISLRRLSDIFAGEGSPLPPIFAKRGSSALPTHFATRVTSAIPTVTSPCVGAPTICSIFRRFFATGSADHPAPFATGSASGP